LLNVHTDIVRRPKLSGDTDLEETPKASRALVQPRPGIETAAYLNAVHQGNPVSTSSDGNRHCREIGPGLGHSEDWPAPFFGKRASHQASGRSEALFDRIASPYGVGLVPALNPKDAG